MFTTNISFELHSDHIMTILNSYFTLKNLVYGGHFMS